MKHLYKILISLALFLSVNPVLAHSNHSHTEEEIISKEKAQELAKDSIESLVERKKIPESWSSIKINTLNKKYFKGKEEWIATFINNAIEDIKKTKLYVFITLHGKVLAINYTGQ